MNELHTEWRNLQKSLHKKSSNKQTGRENSFASKLDNLFDVASENALNEIKGDVKEFLISQRQPGRVGSLLQIYDKCTEKKAKQLQRKEKEEERKRKSQIELEQQCKHKFRWQLTLVIPLNEERKMVKALKMSATEKKRVNATPFELKTIYKDKQLSAFVNANTMNFFKRFEISYDFLNADPESWHEREDYNDGQCFF